MGLKTNDVHESNYKRGYRFLTLCYVPGEVIQKGDIIQFIKEEIGLRRLSDFQVSHLGVGTKALVVC